MEARRMSKESAPDNVKNYAEIRIEIEPPIAWIILNRPHRLNAITPKMISEIEDALKELHVREDVKVIIFAGSGDKAFSAGADVNLLKESDTTYSGYTLTIGLSRLAAMIEEYPKPTIAAIKGYALGGGFELALACDYRLATENARIGLPEINLGLLPAGGGMQRLLKMVGVARTKELAMLGEQIDSNEAKRIGLLTKVFPSEGFDEEVKKFALRVAEIPQHALKAVKLAIRAESESSFSSGSLLESFLFDLLITTKDSKERIEAFLRHRKQQSKVE